MSNASTERLLTSFFCSPSAARLARLQRRAFRSPGFDPTGSFILPLETAVATGNPAELLEQLAHLPWFAQVSPRRHFVEARIRENLGEIAEMEASVARMRACLRGLMQTGEGTRDAPYRVTFVTDERDLLRVLRGQLRYQELVDEGDQRWDVLTMHSGEEVWFDVTPLLACHGAAAMNVERHLLAD